MTTESTNTQAEPLPLGGADGCDTDLRMRYFGAAANGGRQLTDDHVRLYLADCCHFLRQLAVITSGVVESMGLGQVRKIVAEETPVPENVIGEDGTMKKPEPAPDRDHRKNPRGRKHPLVTMLQMALQGVRMLMQITCGTHPNAHNEETLEQRQLREELKERDRTFQNLLKGKV
jgi:hypothetical protein